MIFRKKIFHNPVGNTRTVKYNTENSTLYSWYLINHCSTITTHIYCDRCLWLLIQKEVVLCELRTEFRIDLLVFRALIVINLCYQTGSNNTKKRIVIVFDCSAS